MSEPVHLDSTAQAPTRELRSPLAVPRKASTELFGGAERLVIEHRGEEYQLRITRQGKLILTK